MNLQQLEEHVIEEIRAAGRVAQIYPDRDNPGIVHVEVEGRSYVLIIMETVDPEDLLEA